MYFSTAAVSWTKASICSCRLRHQLQIDFITHSNPQLGIANATLMRTRNPKQVYIVFCRAVRGEPTKWFQHRQLFAETFSCSIFASQQFSDFVDQMLPVGRLPAECSHKETETVRWTNPRLDWIWLQLPRLLRKTIFQVRATLALTSDHEATLSNDIITFCDIWHYCLCMMTIDKTDGIMETGYNYIRRSDPGEIEIYNAPLLCCLIFNGNHVFHGKDGGRLILVPPSAKSLDPRHWSIPLGFGPRIFALLAPCS